MVDKTKETDRDKYIRLLEKNSNTQHRLTCIVENQTRVLSGLSENISALNTNIINNNQLLHQNINSIKNELMVWIKKLAIILLAVLLTIGGLKLSGVI